MADKLTCGSCRFRAVVIAQSECRRFPPQARPAIDRAAITAGGPGLALVVAYTPVDKNTPACGEHKPDETGKRK